jgi:hypothetical protein
MSHMFLFFVKLWLNLKNVRLLKKKKYTYSRTEGVGHTEEKAEAQT